GAHRSAARASAAQAEVGLHLRPGRAVPEGPWAYGPGDAVAGPAAAVGDLQTRVRPRRAQGPAPPAPALALLHALVDERRRALAGEVRPAAANSRDSIQPALRFRQPIGRMIRPLRSEGRGPSGTASRPVRCREPTGSR